MNSLNKPYTRTCRKTFLIASILLLSWQPLARGIPRDIVLASAASFLCTFNTVFISRADEDPYEHNDRLVYRQILKGAYVPITAAAVFQLVARIYGAADLKRENRISVAILAACGLGIIAGSIPDLCVGEMSAYKFRLEKTRRTLKFWKNRAVDLMAVGTLVMLSLLK